MKKVTDKKQDRSRQNHTRRNRTAPELLAPAGSFEICKAVVQAGADAVYAGGSRYGARAFAENFTQEELLRAIDFVHLHGKKLYLTVNTLLKQIEMDTLYEYLLPYYLEGLDAVIVQDFGVMQHIRHWFVDLPVHISTQMSVAGVYGVSYLQKLGAARIVTARELSLEEIREIRRQSDVEIECFVHGALCYCYSGQCLLSSMLGARSGNRGRCAQPCRLPYTILDEERKPCGKNGYPLSPKDLCTIDQIPQLTEAGITSFKIEGRMKSVEYAAGVTALYRKYIDVYMEKGYLRVDKQDYECLLQTGNRSGFTSGYYNKHNGADMITMTHPRYEKSVVFDQHKSYAYEKKLAVQASARFKIGEPAVFTVSSRGCLVSAEHGVVQAAQTQPVSREMILTQLSKTGNTPFNIEQIEIQMDPNVFLPKQMLNQLRRKALGQLEEQMLEQSRRTVPDAVAEQKPLQQDAAQKNDNKDTDARVNFTAAVEQAAQLCAVLEQEWIRRVYLDSSMYRHEHFTTQLKEHIARIHAAGKQAFFILPPVLRSKTAAFYKERWQDICNSGVDGYLVKTMDELGFLEQMQADKQCCVLDHSLYTYSNETKESYCRCGWSFDTVPLELNKKELFARNNTASELIVYGYLPLMTSAQCIKKTMGRCTKTNGICYLKDRYAKEFAVRNVCNECYNTIYNAQPMSLIQLADEIVKLHPAAYRLCFTTESKQMVSQILYCVKTSFFERQTTDLMSVIGEYTNGHYKRGVE